MNKVWIVFYSRKPGKNQRGNGKREWFYYSEHPSLQQAEHEALRQTERGDGHDYAVFEMVAAWVTEVKVVKANLGEPEGIPAPAEAPVLVENDGRFVVQPADPVFVFDEDDREDP